MGSDCRQTAGHVGNSACGVEAESERVQSSGLVARTFRSASGREGEESLATGPCRSDGPHGLDTRAVVRDRSEGRARRLSTGSSIPRSCARAPASPRDASDLGSPCPRRDTESPERADASASPRSTTGEGNTAASERGGMTGSRISGDGPPESVLGRIPTGSSSRTSGALGDGRTIRRSSARSGQNRSRIGPAKSARPALGGSNIQAQVRPPRREHRQDTRAASSITSQKRL